MVATTKSASPLHLTILMPLRDDWASALELIRRLDDTVNSADYVVEILLIDDGSLQTYGPNDFKGSFSAVRKIRTLRLLRNLGHQRAIAIGLAHLQKTSKCDAVLVMDSDGEDTPAGVVELLRTYKEVQGAKAVFAERSRRSESIVFRIFYRLYRILHRSLTGVSVRVGNFSILPREFLDTLVVMSELWNHYAATIFRSRHPFTMIPIARGTRIAGESRMNFVSLVSHGLSAISVFGDIVGVRLMIWSLFGSVLAAFGIAAVLIVRFFTDRAIPGWATIAIGALVIIMIQFITIASSFTFFTLSNRTNLGFMPTRDYLLFVKETVDIYSYE